MPRTADFHSINEVKKPALNRVYHNNSTCPVGCNVKAAGEYISGQKRLSALPGLRRAERPGKVRRELKKPRSSTWLFIGDPDPES